MYVYALRIKRMKRKKGTYQINEYLHNRIYPILAIYRNFVRINILRNKTKSSAKIIILKRKEKQRKGKNIRYD